MPNRYQIAFVCSFLLTFAALYVATSYLNAVLKAAGYDVSKLILIGLPMDNSSVAENITEGTTLPEVEPHASLDFLTVMRQGGYVQLVTLALAALTSVFIFAKFAGGRT